MKVRLALLLASAIFTACVAGGNDPTATGCGPLNCAGCCQFGVCQAGNGNVACGLQGSICAICAQGEACSVAGFCSLDLKAKWSVRPVRALIESSNKGSSWDADGSAPDVAVTTTCAGTSIGVSETIQSYKPSWQSGACVATAGDLLAKGVVFTMRDMDLSVHDSITGHIRDWKRISRSLSHRDGAASRTFGPRAGDPQSKQMGGVND